MTFQQNNKLIYELEEDDEPKMQTPKNGNITKIDRKLGAVSYIKWGTLYNYQFSFDIRKGRLLCYKTPHSNNYNNYYSLNKGEFFKDEQEIQRFETQLKKKKNYINLDNDQVFLSYKQNLIYVRTTKGRLFKLLINNNENYDKILGYLQMCFSSKIQTVKAFYALLGVGIVSINEQQFRLTTGVLVSLNDWTNNADNNNYLQKNDNNFNLLISNIELLGGIISAFYNIHEFLGIVFNPQTQTIDIILFDNLQVPQYLYPASFKIIKKKRNIQPSGKGQLLKLKTDIQILDENGDYLQIAQNDHVKVFCRKNLLKIVDYALVQGSMLSAKYIDDQSDLQPDKIMVNNALEFYNKNKTDIIKDDTKEFIIVYRQAQQGQQGQMISSPEIQKPQRFNDHFEDINEERSGVQIAKSIKVHMRNSNSNSSPPKYMSEFLQNKPILHFADQISEFQDIKSAIVPVSFGPSVNDQFQQHQESQIELKQTLKQEEDEEPDLVKASIVFDESEHNPHRDHLSIMKYSSEFKKIDYKDEYRIQAAHKKGGTACQDEKIIDLARSVGKNMIRQVGQKLLSGNFNLTTISFPIKAMIPKSALEKTFMQTILFPLYMNKATISTNPVERLKLLIIALISNYIQANSFLKPLNPVLGETFEGGFEDGTTLFCEQISHHPPLSYFLVYGPKKSYKMFGYSLYEAKAGLNSLTLLNHGKRTIQFENQKITCTFSQEHYSGTFFGTMKHESQGQILFNDEQNGLSCNVVLGKVKNKPTDYVEGEIKQGKTVLGRLYGSYMGFMEFDGVRYWDARVIKPFAMKIHKSQLESDHTNRSDRMCMLRGDMIKAQLEKERLEDIQRKDAALRKNFQKLLQNSNKKKKN